LKKRYPDYPGMPISSIRKKIGITKNLRAFSFEANSTLPDYMITLSKIVIGMDSRQAILPGRPSG
jgi:hypothetical protein